MQIFLLICIDLIQFYNQTIAIDKLYNFAICLMLIGRSIRLQISENLFIRSGAISCQLQFLLICDQTLNYIK